MHSGGGDGLGFTRLNPSAPAAEMVGTSGGGGGGRGKDERVPQWSSQETRDLIAIRGELERDFTVSKRNKTLWELVASRLAQRGYRRTPDQCKCKWKNLINRYKGKETSDPENGRQCPFFEELHTIFTERERNMQRELLKSESGASNVTKKLKRFSGDRSSEEPSDDDEEDEDSDDDHHTRSRKRKADRVQQQQRTTDKSASAATGIHSLLQDFLHQQQQMEIQWQEMMERRTQERLMFEQNWRQSMEKLERERLMMEQAWWEREEQRRIREEVRAEKRDTLLTTLLNKLIQDDQ
ncbi:trihelix transcription factor GT-3b-like [Typha angustifolia]|uniref:trihelix transcription factor GT-3b-like n=1 Tax=Typha angustifolia TaxID=59011 RepID=UPI003C2AEC3E